LKKIPNFFKKSFSMRGVYLIFGGVTNIPPWSDFENLARFSKSDPYVHLGGTLCISAFLVSSYALSTILPYTLLPIVYRSHTAHSSMTTTKRVTRIVHI
jgi:hypothetical protein